MTTTTTTCPDPRVRAIAVDDDAALLRGLRRMLEQRGFEVTTVCDGHEAVAALRADPDRFDVMLSDVSMPAMGGLELVAEVRRHVPHLPIVMLTGDRTAGTAVRALKAGAFNYLTKPITDPDEVVEVLSRAAAYGRLERHARELERRVSLAARFDQLVGASAPMRELFQTLERVAQLDVAVLVRGESGTGKELVARAIHDHSRRAAGPFVALNCAALPETLVDSELFGHVRGAFTGAVDARAGAFERADRGTLFLDEIGDIPPGVQVRLLRVLQEGEITRVGDGAPRKLDVRVIAATWVDLEAARDAGELRPDLYYRLHVVTLDVPPLRARRDDLPLLIAHLAKKHAERMGRSTPSFSSEALEAMTRYAWPGNVRELENAVQHALALAPGDAVPAAALPEGVRDGARAAARARAAADGDASWMDALSIADARRLALDRFEAEYVRRILRSTGGNISEASRRASIDRSNLRKIMARVGIDAESFRTDE